MLNKLAPIITIALLTSSSFVWIGASNAQINSETRSGNPSRSLGQLLSQSTTGDLSGTSWQLVQFQGSDDTTLIPDDKGKYTITFNADASVSVRIDCNRGQSTWQSDKANQLQFGILALTRAMCPPGSLHDRIVGDWEYVRSYVIRDGHLFLSLMADGGIYEFEPIP